MKIHRGPKLDMAQLGQMFIKATRIWLYFDACNTNNWGICPIFGRKDTRA